MEQQEKFWDEVYCQDSQNTKEPDDWILSSAESMKIIETKILQPMIKTRNNNNNNNKIRLLIAGCGTSNLGIDLYIKYSNILNITNIDILNEKNYLIFLRPNLKNLTEDEILKIIEHKYER